MAGDDGSIGSVQCKEGRGRPATQGRREPTIVSRSASGGQAMRPYARPILGIAILLALAAGPSRARAQGYAAVPRQAPVVTYSYAQPRAYYVQPRTYYVQPRAYYAPAPTYYAPAPRTRPLLRVRKYSDRDTAAYKYILVDPSNPHWTFDYNEWIAHNF
jgi:hypothetical protein